MNSDTQQAIENVLAMPIKEFTPVSGGDINEAYQLTLKDGRQVFAKTNEDAAPTMFETEATGLAWLTETNTLRIPSVIAVSEPADEIQFLLLEFIESRERVTDFDEKLARGLMALHQSGAPCFGLEDRSNAFIGTLPQSNQPHETWAEFYILQRLEPMLKRAVDARQSSSYIKSGMQKLFAKMEDRVGEPEPPSRLHGDLWSGNLMVDERGEPVLVDPAAYGGHRETDLAMMRLFGGFSDGVFSDYHNAMPLSEGWRDRIPLYQLYPLLVHLNLFGGQYGEQVERELRKVM